MFYSVCVTVGTVALFRVTFNYLLYLMMFCIKGQFTLILYLLSVLSAMPVHYMCISFGKLLYIEELN